MGVAAHIVVEPARSTVHLRPHQHTLRTYLAHRFDIMLATATCSNTMQPAVQQVWRCWQTQDRGCTGWAGGVHRCAGDWAGCVVLTACLLPHHSVHRLLKEEQSKARSIELGPSTDGRSACYESALRHSPCR